MTTEERAAEPRYGQLDLYDIHRAAYRWQTLLAAYSIVGLSEPEMAVWRACGEILGHIRMDPLGAYRLCNPQMGFDEVDADE